MAWTPESKVHGANMGPTWGRQDPGGPHVGHMNLAIWEHYFLLTDHVWREYIGHRFSKHGVSNQVMRSFRVFCVLSSNKLLNKEWNCRGSETPWCSCDAIVMINCDGICLVTLSSLIYLPRGSNWLSDCYWYVTLQCSNVITGSIFSKIFTKYTP